MHLLRRPWQLGFPMQVPIVLHGLLINYFKSTSTRSRDSSNDFIQESLTSYLDTAHGLSTSGVVAFSSNACTARVLTKPQHNTRAEGVLLLHEFDITSACTASQNLVLSTVQVDYYRELRHLHVVRIHQACQCYNKSWSYTSTAQPSV